MTSHLLAIDLGLRCGFAAFDPHGGLLTYRSTNFGSRGRLKKAAWGVLREYDGLNEIVVEGDRNLASVWQSVADKQEIVVESVAPETWRRDLLDPRLRRSGADAKEAAGELARALISFCDLPGPTSLRHDAAEAICIGLWRAVRLDLPLARQFVSEL